MRKYFFIKGLSCGSCELLVENEILKIAGVEKAKVDSKNSAVLVEFENINLSSDDLNSLFKDKKYIFSEKPFNPDKKPKLRDFIIAFDIAIFIVIIFVLLDKSGLLALANVGAASSLPAFFVFGLFAGFSTCAALVGGIVLSLSKNWSGRRPHILFNISRLISYGAFGFIFGFIGDKLQFSLKFAPFIVIFISLIMAVLALNMLEIKIFKKIQSVFSIQKFITRRFSLNSNLKEKYFPLVIGAATFFLPCGFTITAQSFALLSGNALQGGLIMFMFALGTLPMLLIIGFSSAGFLKNSKFSSLFTKTAGILVLFFAFFNVNGQLNVLGFKSLNDIKINFNKSIDKQDKGMVKDNNDLVPIIDGKQILKMEASSSSYSPNYFKVRAGVPVKWEIEDKGTSGCTNAVISKDLFDGEINLTPGEISVKEFVPQERGKYKFSCWMGMVSGVIEVL